MIYLAVFFVFFFALRFAVVVVNILFSPVLKKQKQHDSPKVSLLIPARNEEKNISNILKDIQSLTYPNLEVVVFDDESTDKTREIVKAFSAKDNRIGLLESPGLPEGWLGKNNACHILAQSARGDYFLFLDSDVRLRPGILESALAQMQKHNLKLLSIFPKQIMKTNGEKMIVPLMNSILLSLLPLILTRTNQRPSLAAANGQFMLFERKTYLQIQPHKRVKNLLVEDILIARLYKTQKLKMQCMTGNETISCRMYQGYHDALKGLARSVVEFFGGSHLVAFFYWVSGTLGIFFIAFFLPPVFTFASLAVILATKAGSSYLSRQPIIQNLWLALPQQLLLGRIVIESYRNKKNNKFRWKGRNIG